MRFEKIQHFLFAVRDIGESIPVLVRTKLIAFYTITLCTLVAVPFNIIGDLKAGDYLFAGLLSIFFCLVISGIAGLWINRNFAFTKAMFTAAVFLLLGGLIADAGGVKGLGFLYFIAGFPVLHYVTGVRGSLALSVFLVIGVAIRLKLGHFYPESILQDPDVIERYMMVIVIAALMGSGSILHQHILVRNMAKAAYEDPVTGIDSRIRVDEKVLQAISSSSNQKKTFSLIAIKIIHFARLNSTHGTHRVDAILRELAGRIKLLAEPGTMTGRYSGSIFMVMINIHDPEILDSYARRMKLELLKPYAMDDTHINIEIRLAITRFPDDGNDADRLMSNLMAILSSKMNPDDPIDFYDEKRYREELEREAMAAALRLAMTNNELHLVYHPKVWTKNRLCCGAEILLRWNNPRFGNVSPALFIPIAEETGFIREISHWVLQTAFWELAQLKSEIPEQFSQLIHAINLSSRDFQDRGIVAYINELSASTGVSPTSVELEMTEGVMMDDNPQTRKNLEEFELAGYRLAIDDFGTGYSSLSYLNRLKVDNLKIDQSFIRQIVDSTNELPIVNAIISMATSLKLEITAEGVETATQEAFLIKYHCPVAQGWLYAKPMPLPQYREWLLKNRSQVNIA